MRIYSKKEYKGTLIWENLKNEGGPESSYRAKIPGGWLFQTYSANTGLGRGSGVTFVPDPEHLWTGSSYEENKNNLT